MRLSLTARGRSVARCLLNGYGTQRIARELGISVETVKIYKFRIIQATGMDNCPSAVLAILRSPDALAYVFK